MLKDSSLEEILTAVVSEFQRPWSEKLKTRRRGEGEGEKGAGLRKIK
jgi:hypothetical protein